MLKKFLIASATTLTFAAPITAVISCGSGSDSKSALNPKGVLTVARWGNDIERASQQVAISAFEEKHNVKVKLLTLDYGKRIEQISKWAASGDLPDIIETDGADFSNYAVSEIIKKLDVSKIDENVLKGLIPASLGTMIGHVQNGKWMYNKLSSAITKDSVKDKLWGMPKEFNTLGVYLNRKAFDWTKKLSTTLSNNIFGKNISSLTTSTPSYDEYKKAWEELASKKSNKLYKLLEAVYDGSKAELKKKTKNNKKGAISFTNDPNRFTQFFSNENYEEFKAYNLSDIETNKAKLTTAVKAWWGDISNLYLNMNKDGGAITSQGHGYGWNGEAFDKKGVGAVIEGQWYTPSSKIYTNSDTDWDIWTAPNPGLFPQGWAITKSSNDDDLAYKFMSYLASEKGSQEQTSKTGANPVNKNAIAQQYQKAIDSMKGTSTAFSKGIAKKILAHGKSFVSGSTGSLAFNPNSSGKPLLFTSEYPLFQKAWIDAWADHLDGPLTNQAAYNTIIDKVIKNWIKEIKDAV